MKPTATDDRPGPLPPGVQPEIGTKTPTQTASVMALVSLRRAEKRAADLAYQAANTTIVDGYTISPAIGHSRAGVHTGWELVPPAGQGSDWYLGSREQAVEAIQRHRLAWGKSGLL